MAHRIDPPAEHEPGPTEAAASGAPDNSGRRNTLERGRSRLAGRRARSAPTATSADGSIRAALAEAQAAISVLGAADTALDEIGFLLRRLRTVAVQAATVAIAGGDPSHQQHDVFTLVGEISAIGSQASFNGTRLFDGTLTDQVVWVGAAGQPVRVHLEPLSGTSLGLERPWGHANRAAGLPARLVSSTGTLPSGIFRVCAGVVFDETGRQVGSYTAPTVDFGSAVTATFDHSLYYRDDTAGSPSGTFTLNSVISVRNPRAVDRALVTVGEALAEVSRRRAAVATARLQLTDAVATLGVLGASQQTDADRVGYPDPADLLTASTVATMRDEPETASLATEPPGPRRLAGLLTGPSEPGH